ncbi:hypothetical protein [Methylogaea oryzae]|uniref:hypothetical protein n=1 Tax=Methylogaea oryzae TaxID=1295382 RepID=UPI001C3F1E61|nr:hypothetical protein [Methylogaea oryzae]
MFGYSDYDRWDIASWLLALLLLCLASCAPEPVAAADTIPRAAIRYRGDLVRQAHLVWGLEAPVADFAGQIHQESAWRPEAESKFAGGLAQFTPDTARWICGAYPAITLSPGPSTEDAKRCDVFNPTWAVRAW